MKFNFQLVFLIVFIVAAVFGVLVFSGAIPLGSDGEGSQGTVVLWGTLSSSVLAEPIEEFNRTTETYSVKYEEKSPANFERDLLEALATGTGPDMFFISDDLVFHYANKIIAIPYTSYSEAAFKNTFAGGGEVFLTKQGIVALPMSIDPLVLYYNRSILDAEGIVAPPKDWEEFAVQSAKLTQKDEANIIERSGAALGQYANVTHAKEILSTLFMQAGNPIILENEQGLHSALDEPIGTYNLPSILEFYASFADPAKPLYSWNRSFNNSQDVFSSENLAFYFGFAGELLSLVNKNPNQNFFVAPVPQIKDSKFKLTAAHVTGIAVTSSSRNLNTALTAANALASSNFAVRYAQILGVPPARRDLLAQPPESSFAPIFYNSALFARSWLDPARRETDSIFNSMVGAVLSNNMSESEAVQDASSKLELLLLSN